MDPWELANTSLVSQRNEIISESEKHIVLKTEEGPMIKKTHKGDIEILPSGDGHVIPQVPVAQPVSMPVNRLVGDVASDSDDDVPLDRLARPPAAEAHTRRSSDIGASLATCTGQPDYRAYVDPKTSAAFNIVASVVSGPPLHVLLPASLEIAGRTSLDRLHEFIAQILQKKSSSKTVVVMRVAAASDADEAVMRSFSESYAERKRAATCSVNNGQITVHLVPTACEEGRALLAELGSVSSGVMAVAVFANAK